MRILFLTENFPPETNASAARVFERACYWVRWGNEVTVITCAPNFPQGKIYPGYRNRWHQTEDMEGIRVVRVKTFISPNEGFFRRTLDFVSFMFSALLAGLFEKKPDVVIATSPQFFAAVGGWALAGIRRKPFVFELGDLWPASISAVGAMQESVLLLWLEALELFLYRRSAAVVALTRAFRDDLVRRGIHNGKIAVVVNGVDLARYAPRERDRVLAKRLGIDRYFVAGYIGTHGVAHSLENVLDAAQVLHQEADIRFLLVGAGAARERLMADVRGRGLDNVIFIPSQPKSEMPAYWSLCDVALIHLKDGPVFQTVIPSKIFEAMAMGLPLLVVAPRGEASAVVEGEGAGIWVRAGDPNALADAVLRLKRRKRERLEFAQRSLAAAPRYSRERQARDMLLVLERVLEGKGERVAGLV